VTAKDWTRFRDSVAAEVAEEYPRLDNLDAVVARAIERRRRFSDGSGRRKGRSINSK
jgi:hypothetical protein